jgi:hypothetical protein
MMETAEDRDSSDSGSLADEQAGGVERRWATASHRRAMTSLASAGLLLLLDNVAVDPAGLEIPFVDGGAREVGRLCGRSSS